MKYAIIRFLGVSLFFFPFIVNAQSTDIYFLNGIQNNAVKSGASTIALEAAVREIGLSEAGPDGFTVKPLFNSTEGFITDNLELRAQAAINGEAEAFAQSVVVAYTNYYRSANNDLYPQREALDALYTRVYNEQLSSAYYEDQILNRAAGTAGLDQLRRVTEDVISNITQSLDQGRNVVIISHSQGNLYAESAYSEILTRDLYTSEQLARVRFIGVAAVSTTTPNENYITITADRAVRFFNFTHGLLGGTRSLEPNFQSEIRLNSGAGPTFNIPESILNTDIVSIFQAVIGLASGPLSALEALINKEAVAEYFVAGVILRDPVFHGFPEVYLNDNVFVIGSNISMRRLLVSKINNSIRDIRQSLAIIDDQNPLFDNDGDGIPNGYENENGYDRNNPADAALDVDNDGLTTLEEFRHNTDSRRAEPVIAIAPGADTSSAIVAIASNPSCPEGTTCFYNFFYSETPFSLDDFTNRSDGGPIARIDGVILPEAVELGAPFAPGVTYYLRVVDLNNGRTIRVSNQVSFTLTAVAPPPPPPLPTSRFDDRLQAVAGRSLSINGNSELHLGVGIDGVLQESLINVKAADTESSFTYAVINNGDVYAMGANRFGQLGIGTNDGSSTWVRSGAITNIKQVLATAVSGFAVGESGELYAVGRNGFGNLGSGDNIDKSVWTLVLTDVSGVYGKVGPLQSDVTFAIKSDSSLWATGENTRGQLGTGDQIDRNIWGRVLSGVRSVVTSGANSFAIMTDDSLWVTGNGATGAIGTDSTLSWVKVLENVKEVATNGRSSFAITRDGNLFATGFNGAGELGTGDTESRFSWTLVQTDVVFATTTIDFNSGIAAKSYALKSNGDFIRASAEGWTAIASEVLDVSGGIFPIFRTADNNVFRVTPSGNLFILDNNGE